MSTAEYYRRLNELMQIQLGGVASARIVLESLNHQAYVDAVIERRDEEAACEMVLDGCQNLENGGQILLLSPATMCIDLYPR